TGFVVLVLVLAARTARRPSAPEPPPASSGAHLASLDGQLTASAEPGSPRTQATQVMAERLASLALRSDPNLNRFDNERRVVVWRRALDEAGEPAARRQRTIALSNELLAAGQPEEAKT